MDPLELPEVIAHEKELLRRRREQLGQKQDAPGQENWFGIALSGGGIRSATINLGFLRTLNRFGILQKADYLSSVSGGGYTHAYVQGTLKNKGSFEALFTDDHAKAFREHGEYMTPGAGFGKNRSLAVLIVAFLVSWIMSVVSLVIVGGILYSAYQVLVEFVPQLELPRTPERLTQWYLGCVGILLLVHFAINVMFVFSLGLSKLFNRIEAALAAVGLGLLTWIFIVNAFAKQNLQDTDPTAVPVWVYGLAIAAFILLGFVANPNGLSFHRFYRKQLADLFLRFAGPHDNICLKDLVKTDGTRREDFLAPYPLINTCLNLQNPSGDYKFQGVKASDYFLLSPLFCGAKLLGYVPTGHFSDFRAMTLPAAVTISAAAVNPGMGMYSSKLRSTLLTLFNARLGFWVSNPLKNSGGPVWWPQYFFKELLGRIGTNNRKVNISDGGHIENFGAYELLRRGCRLVIAVDAGEDRAYAFADLNNLLLRARNELGLEIRFREGQQPEDVIAPKPSQVYSNKRYAVADIMQWWVDEKEPKVDVPAPTPYEEFPRKIGTFVYVKSSVTAPGGRPPEAPDVDLQYSTYYYKIYHPEFPHESTGDQFFDPVQWQSYYRLGQYIGADVLGLGMLGKAGSDVRPQFSTAQLIDWFDAKQPLFTDEAVEAVANPEGGFESVNTDEVLTRSTEQKAAKMAGQDVCRM